MRKFSFLLLKKSPTATALCKCKYSCFQRAISIAVVMRKWATPHSKGFPIATAMLKCFSCNGATTATVKLETWGAIPACYHLTFVLLVLFSQLSMFLKLCIMNILLHILLCQSCRGLGNVSLGGLYIPFLGLMNMSYLAEYDDVIRGPLFSFASVLLKPKSTTGPRSAFMWKKDLSVDDIEQWYNHQRARSS